MTKINLSPPILHLYGYIYLLLVLLPAQPSEAQRTPPTQHGLRRVNPSTAIIVAVLISAFFLMGFFSIYLRKCAGDSVGSVRRIGTRGRSRRAAASRGLDQAVIESFPTFEYSVVKGLKLGKDALECAVCLNEFEDEETLRLLPKCSHVFHPECIDAWLGTHTTCPVCRSNLMPGSSDTEAPPVETLNTEIATEGDARDAETVSQVAIDVPDESTDQISVQDRPIRSKSTRRPFKFPRSHTTGHSLVPPGEDVERFTLRLPEHVRKEIVDGKLSRTTSCGVFPAGGGSDSSSRGYRSGAGWEGSGRRRNFQFGRFDRKAKSDRWGFSLAPPFFMRTLSVRSSKGVDGDQTPNAKGLFPSVKAPFDCLGAKDEPTAEQSAARGSAPVFTVAAE
ncbi:E3 ubiquitin-protein ligase ATL31-like [Magnolia sinica]|uniref:E3 ubiquitin-protein ligase ATL31-like n=1 Tax=Magnolia sinica TaxID=86752 RepID=UPI0026595885|nr:E3 ubiquitin-protein ligase ATL31-like [Magnolia sinica]